MNCRLTVAGAARWGHRPWGGGRIRLAAPFLVHSTTKYVSGHDTSPLELGGGVRRFAVSARLDFPEARVQEKDGLLRREPHLPRDGRWLRSARFWVLALVSASFGGSLLLLLPDRKRAKSLNPKTFVPFTITSREQVSPTSFVLTVEPAAAAEETYAAAWAHGLWSIEVKQPQLQIARDYTPLPPVGGGDDSRSRGTPGPLPAGALRFLLRKIDGGEVSTYLSRLGVGDTVELRGPRLGFDVRRRLGGAPSAVLIAGGTGIAPALQVAEAVLGGPDPAPDATVSIVWANRSRADCVGCPRLGAVAAGDGSAKGGEGGAVMEQLREMKRRHGDRLRLACLVDQEGTFLRERDVHACLQEQQGRRRQTTSAAAALQPENGDKQLEEAECVYHSAERLERLARDPPSPDGRVQDLTETCRSCGSAGRSLVVVSGPDGFVQALAGAKRWEDGEERQGAVGGILGRIALKHPDLMDGWLVLKL